MKSNPEAFGVWPVLDLMDGRVVRGVAGNRGDYQPVDVDPHPVRVFSKLLDNYEHAFTDCYVADLDALEGRAFQSTLLRELCSAFPLVRFWIDAGFSSIHRVRRFELESEVGSLDRVVFIVASEALVSWLDLAEIAALESRHIAFSLDLVNGVVRSSDEEIAQQSPESVVDAVVALGFNDVIVLDIAQVGVRGGVSTLPLCQRIQECHPTIRLVTGGGVRDRNDLRRIRDAGCHAALVATALHDKTIDLSGLRDFV